MGRIVFLGTAEFAVASLQRLLESGQSVEAVFTQPDRPKGRGGQLAASPVKQAARQLGLTVHQPERVRRPEVVEQVRPIGPGAMVVVGCGQNIPQSIHDSPGLRIRTLQSSVMPH